MLKVIKPENVNNLEEPVKIPDAVIIKKPKINAIDAGLSKAKLELTGLDEEDTEKIDKYFADSKKQMLEEVGKEYEKISEDSKQLIEDSRNQSETMLKEAREKAAKIIENAEKQGEEIRRKSKEEGFVEGQKIKFEEITHMLDELEQLVGEMKSKQQQQFNSFYGDLKYFAIDIAERVVYRKIDRDDEYLRSLVIEALKGVRDAEWVTVQMSEQMTNLVVKLKAAQLDGEIAGNVEFKTDNSDVGTVKIKTPDQVIDASIPTQLANIKRYFETYGDEEND